MKYSQNSEISTSEFKIRNEIESVLQLAKWVSLVCVDYIKGEIGMHILKNHNKSCGE